MSPAPGQPPPWTGTPPAVPPVNVFAPMGGGGPAGGGPGGGSAVAAMGTILTSSPALRGDVTRAGAMAGSGALLGSGIPEFGVRLGPTVSSESTSFRSVLGDVTRAVATVNAGGVTIADRMSAYMPIGGTRLIDGTTEVDGTTVVGVRGDVTRVEELSRRRGNRQPPGRTIAQDPGGAKAEPERKTEPVDPTVSVADEQAFLDDAYEAMKRLIGALFDYKNAFRSFNEYRTTLLNGGSGAPDLDKYKTASMVCSEALSFAYFWALERLAQKHGMTVVTVPAGGIQSIDVLENRNGLFTPVTGGRIEERIAEETGVQPDVRLNYHRSGVWDVWGRYLNGGKYGPSFESALEAGNDPSQFWIANWPPHLGYLPAGFFGEDGTYPDLLRRAVPNLNNWLKSFCGPRK